MSDPVLVHIDHGVESWDGPINDNMDKIDANFVRSTKSADYGQKTYCDHASVTTGALSGASKALSGLIPAGCMLKGITTRVITAVTGATSVDTGDGTTVDQFGHHTAVALGTTTDYADHKSGFVPTLYKTAGDVVLTAVGSNFTGGNVRVTAHFEKIVAPTS